MPTRAVNRESLSRVIHRSCTVVWTAVAGYRLYKICKPPLQQTPQRQGLAQRPLRKSRSGDYRISTWRTSEVTETLSRQFSPLMERRR